MFKKFTLLFALCFAAFACFMPYPSAAEDASFVQLRIAATIAKETSGSNWKSARLVAAVVRIRYDHQKKYKSYTNLTWSDILYGNNEFEGSRSLAGLSAQELQAYGQKQAGRNWSICLQAAKEALNNTIDTSITQGANSFNKSHGAASYRNGKQVASATLFTDPVGHRFYWQELGQFNKYSNYKHYSDEGPGADVGDYSNNVPEQNSSGSSGTSGSSGLVTDLVKQTFSNQKPNGAAKAGMCGLKEMKAAYLDPSSEDKACWYCNVVVILTNAYLNAAAAALPSSVTLAELILKLGFIIWLAYYILQQVSSFTPASISKILQEVIVMLFKVALAGLGIKYASSAIVEYYVNPIAGLGAESGKMLFDKLLP